MSLERLHDLVPGLPERHRPCELGAWPTPVERVAIERWPRFYVKREDLSSFTYGGNKVRNLEWLLGDARSLDRKTLVTFGAMGSHFIHALAIHGAEQEFHLRAVLHPQPLTEEVHENVENIRATGASVRVSRGYWDLPFRLAAQFRAARTRGGGPGHWIPPGGASPLGSLGYVQAGIEIAQQVGRGELPTPDYIYCAAGSCGTLVGLAEGLSLAGLPSRIVAIRVVPRMVLWRRGGMQRRLRRMLRRLGANVRASADIDVVHDQVGAGYGHPSRAGEQAMQWGEDHLGVRLDHTYTAKAVAGMRAYIEQHKLQERVHLYLHTCGGAGDSEHGDSGQLSEP